MKFFVPFSYLALITMFFSCKEVLPDRVLIETIDTTYLSPNTSAQQTKVVLFQEYTGTSCINCPDGHDKLKDLTNQYGTNMAVMGLHFGDLSSPAEAKDQDLRTVPAAEIGGYYGVASMPSATIDGKEFGGLKVIGRLDWRANLETIINNPVKVNVSQRTYIDPLSTKHKLELTIEFLEDVSENMTFSIALTEDNIVVSQKNGSIIEENYTQNNVLRKMYTNSLGTSLKKTSGKTIYEKGRVFKKVLNLDGLDGKWNTNNMNIISFVSNESTKEVFQANTIKFK